MATLVDQFGETFFGADAEAHAPSRRAFLTRLGAGAAIGSVLTFAAAQPAAADGKAPNAADISFLAWAQSLEFTAVAAYDLALASGKLSPAIATVANVFRSHHRDHAAAMGAAAGKNGNGAANAALVAKLGPAFKDAASEKDLLVAAFDLETAAASTYLTALGRISGSDPAAAIAAILPTESRHAVVLGDVLQFDKKITVPVLETDAKGLNPSDYPVGG
jgi:rubrerythrin